MWWTLLWINKVFHFSCIIRIICVLYLRYRLIYANFPSLACQEIPPLSSFFLIMVGSRVRYVFVYVCWSFFFYLECELLSWVWTWWPFMTASPLPWPVFLYTNLPPGSHLCWWRKKKYNEMKNDKKLPTQKVTLRCSASLLCK